MVTVPVPVFEHPLKVYVTVYVVVEAGLTVIAAVVAPPGDHEYVPPGSDGVAVIVALAPAQTVCEVAVTVGTGLTVTVPVPVLLQPDKVYVTV